MVALAPRLASFAKTRPLFRHKAGRGAIALDEQ